MSNYVGPSYTQKRRAGLLETGGHIYKRQHDLIHFVMGNGTPIAFSIDNEVMGTYMLIDASNLQPSHLGAVQNPYHFIPEAQPRNRSTSASGALTPERIARNLRPDEILFGSTAYTGAPVVNTRGEVIQGNGRAYAAKLYWQLFPNDDRGYKQAIENGNWKFGFLLLDDQLRKAKIKNPVLVRMVDVSDKEAIALGQFTQADTEAVTTNTTKLKAKARLLTAPVLKRVLAELANKDGDDDKSLAELVRESSVLKVLIKENVIRVDDLENFTRNGTINESGVDFVASILLNTLFRQSDVNTPDVFTLLPVSTQNALKKSTIHLLRASGQKSINKEVSAAILGYRAYLSSGESSIRSWKNQYDLQGKTPADLYSPLELAIIELLQKSTTQKEVVSKFRQYATLVNPRPGTMFEPAQKGLTKREAATKVFGAKVAVDKTTLNRDKAANRSLKSLRKRVVKRRTTPVNPAPEPVTSSINNTMPTATKSAKTGEKAAKKPASKGKKKTSTAKKKKSIGAAKKVKATRKKATGLKAKRKSRAATAKKKAAAPAKKKAAAPAKKKAAAPAKKKAPVAKKAPAEKKKSTGQATSVREKGAGLKAKRRAKSDTTNRSRTTLRVPNKKASDRKEFIEQVSELSDKIHKTSATGEFIKVPVYRVSRRKADKQAMALMTKKPRNVTNVRLKINNK